MPADRARPTSRLWLVGTRGRHFLVVLAACGILLGGCADSTDDGATGSTTSTSTTSTTVTTSETCIGPEFTVEAPSGWQVNDTSEAPACSWFHPEPFELPENSEAVGIAVHLRVENAPFERVTNPDPNFEEVLDRAESQVDGRPAVRLHLRSTGEAMLDEGTEVVAWYVDIGSDRTFAATTIQTGEYQTFTDHVATLDRMVATVDFVDEP